MKGTDFKWADEGALQQMFAKLAPIFGKAKIASNVRTKIRATVVGHVESWRIEQYIFPVMTEDFVACCTRAEDAIEECKEALRVGYQIFDDACAAAFGQSAKTVAGQLHMLRYLIVNSREAYQAKFSKPARRPKHRNTDILIVELAHIFSQDIGTLIVRQKKGQMGLNRDFVLLLHAVWDAIPNENGLRPANPSAFIRRAKQYKDLMSAAERCRPTFYADEKSVVSTR